jgi:hypothetical protein
MQLKVENKVNRRSIAIGFFLTKITMSYSVAQAADVNYQKQYEATMRKIFISQQYKAIPIFRLNPLRPGDVLQIDNETIYRNHSLCYPRLDPPRRDIQPMSQGQRISTSTDLTAKGALLSQDIASIEAHIETNLDDYMLITVNPISDSQAPDIDTLQKFDVKPECHMISDLLNQTAGKYIVAYAVLYGQVQFELTAHFQGEIKTGVQSKIAKEIARGFAINEANVQFSGDKATFYISKSPGDVPLAVVPAQYSLEELARITYYMQGQRGSQLENAVREAISTDDPGAFDKLVSYIRGILKEDGEDKYHEQWAERFFNGKTMLTLDQLHDHSQKDVDFDKIGTYEAAQKLSGS